MGYVQKRRGLEYQHSYDTMNNLFSSMIYRNRAFLFAIMFSILCHLFWLFGVRITINPAGASYVKFSKVSFLGQVSGSSRMEVKATRKGLSFLEKKYRKEVERNIIEDIGLNETSGISQIAAGYPQCVKDAEVIKIIDDAVGPSKLQPA